MQDKLDRIISLLEEIKTLIGADDTETEREQRARFMQERANYNRDHAAELFSDKLRYSVNAGRWYERATGKNVVFTPYGWIDEETALTHENSAR